MEQGKFDNMNQGSICWQEICLRILDEERCHEKTKGLGYLDSGPSVDHQARQNGPHGLEDMLQSINFVRFVLQTVLRDYKNFTDLMRKLNILERQVKRQEQLFLLTITQ